MKSKITLCLIFLLVGSWASSAPTAKSSKKYAPEGTPTRAIQGLDDQIEAYVLNPKTDADRAYNAKLKKEILADIFDAAELCKLALDKHWGNLSAAEQTSFVDLMTRLLEKKGIFSKEQSNRKGKQGRYSLAYQGDKYLNAEKSLSLVRTYVDIPSERLKIELNYKMKMRNGKWMIYDVIVDQASLLDNYRYQFDKIIAKDGYQDLYRRMDSKLKEIEEKEKQKTP